MLEFIQDPCSSKIFSRLNNNGFCQVIPFKVPRKSELFQEDLYPDTQADIPAVTAEEWWVQKKNADPVMMSMADGGGSTGAQEELVVSKATPNILNKAVPTGTAAAASPQVAAGPSEADMKNLTVRTFLVYNTLYLCTPFLPKLIPSVVGGRFWRKYFGKTC